MESGKTFVCIMAQYQSGLIKSENDFKYELIEKLIEAGIISIEKGVAGIYNEIITYKAEVKYIDLDSDESK